VRKKSANRGQALGVHALLGGCGIDAVVQTACGAPGTVFDRRSTSARTAPRAPSGAEHGMTGLARLNTR